ncbi:N-alpha-acetyltransferase 15, NatA auxiliary subunit [Podila horticola]|nr:N-alpha-acetyltransferase 15, NatA auxiliary subunit [Podila horticola]
MRDLPQKEGNLFKQILKCYELRQYKKGLKGAEQILKKFPEHGETLAMKGLFYSHLDKKEEAYDFVKKGLRYDLKSHVCWHVFGLVYRADKNYEEALKCYSQALRIDKDNFQILRDFANLQMQLRNFEGYVETVHRLVDMQPQNRQFWIGLSLGYHLMGKPDSALKVLTTYEEAMAEANSKPDYEQSELLLYHNVVLSDMGDHDAALEHLNTIEKIVLDKKAIKEQRAKFYLALGRLEEAETAYRSLISHNPDNFSYFDGLLKSLGLSADKLSDEDQIKVLDLFKDLQKEYPRSNVAKRLPLRFATGERFSKIADEYLRTMLRKGVPSLFVNIKTLYTDREKEQAIEALMLGYLAHLHKSRGFDNSGEVVEPPTASLWTRYFLAQHYDFKGNTDEALELINKAIEHTPTLVELYMTKGRILKHAGDYVSAMEAVNEARELDLQDRFINSKCTKYMLRADKVAEAEKTIILFSRAEIADPLNDLVEMQAYWFLIESAESHLRQGQTGRALKRFHQIQKMFGDFADDQFDFHAYCPRKMTLRSYVKLLKLEDQLYSHPYYLRAAQSAIRCYVSLFDKPDGDSDEMEGMTESEKKKLRSKQRKAELKAQQDAEESKKKAVAVQDTTKKGKIDDDPEGLKYLKIEDPLAEALKFLRHLEALAGDRIETQLMAFEVYFRKNKLLLALKALLKALKIDARNATLHEQLVRFALAVHKSEIKPSTKTVIDKHWETLYHGQDLAAFTGAFLKQQKDSAIGSVPHLISAAIAASLVSSSEAGKEKAEDILFLMAQEDVKFAKSRSVENVQVAIKTLKSMKSARVQELKAQATAWFPRATVFKV